MRLQNLRAKTCSFHFYFDTVFTPQQKLFIVCHVQTVVEGTLQVAKMIVLRSWLLTLQLTMVAPCRLMVQVVLLPLSMGTTGTWQAMISQFSPTDNKTETEQLHPAPALHQQRTVFTMYYTNAISPPDTQLVSADKDGWRQWSRGPRTGADTGMMSLLINTNNFITSHDNVDRENDGFDYNLHSLSHTFSDI